MPRQPSPSASLIEMPSAAWKRSLARRLLAWFRRHRRDLPWRQSRDPYRIWISEIMLQQTQVATVVPYFNRFLEAFPTIEALAAADEHEVLRLWEGLGYYRRARGMHEAARQMVARFDGHFPTTLAEIGSLPGIGRYTAGAIASIAYDAQAPILEANTVRLLSRLVAFDGDPASGPGQKQLWALAEEILPRRGCGDFNQALMELGSLVCTPKAPDCLACCLAPLCAARAQGRQQEIPRRATRVAIEAVREASVVVWHGGKVFLRKRAAGERWAGLWDFPRFPLEAESAPAARRELSQKVREQTGLAIAGTRHFATLKHGVTRFRITLDCYAATSRGAKSRLAGGQSQWIEPAGLERLALSVTGRKLSRMLDDPAARSPWRASV
ncbi:MAG: A/G-specific adenine glycosylase [Planctomycetota bacterium]|nr:MAG: A/G-specific adenine glycosylase [Planctomycetota bacterium]